MHIGPEIRGAGGPSPEKPVDATSRARLQELTSKSNVVARTVEMVGTASARPKEGATPQSLIDHESRLLSGGNKALENAVNQDGEAVAKMNLSLLIIGQAS